MTSSLQPKVFLSKASREMFLLKLHSKMWLFRNSCWLNLSEQVDSSSKSNHPKKSRGQDERFVSPCMASMERR